MLVNQYWKQLAYTYRLSCVFWANNTCVAVSEINTKIAAKLFFFYILSIIIVIKTDIFWTDTNAFAGGFNTESFYNNTLLCVLKLSTTTSSHIVAIHFRTKRIFWRYRKKKLDAVFRYFLINHAPSNLDLNLQSHIGIRCSVFNAKTTLRDVCQKTIVLEFTTEWF